MEEMRALYEHLNLGEFDKVLPRLENYLASVAGYETNQYELPPKLRAEITAVACHRAVRVRERVVNGRYFAEKTAS